MTVFDLDHHRAAADRAVGAGVAVLGHIHGGPPRGALPVEGAGADDGNVMEAVGEEERMRADFSETFPARGDVGVLGSVGVEENHGVAVDLEGHVVNHVDGAGKEMTGGDADDAATGLVAIGDGGAKGDGARDFGSSTAP